MNKTIFFSIFLFISLVGLVSGVIVSSEAIQITRGSDMLEIGEYLGSVRESLSASDLDALRWSNITTDLGSTKCNQYFRFSDNTTPGSVDYVDSGRVLVNASDYLVFNHNPGDVYGDTIFQHHLNFESGLKSEIESGKLIDLHEKKFWFMDENMSIINTSVNGNEVIIEFIAGEVCDTLEEAERREYVINNTNYSVEVIIISDASGDGRVKFSVNDELTSYLTKGGVYTLNDSKIIGVRKAYANEQGDITSDMVEFCLGALKVSYRDTDVTDMDYTPFVDINNQRVVDGRVSIRGSVTASNVTIYDIKYKLLVNNSGESIYVADTKGLKKYLNNAYGMLNPDWDIVFHGYTELEEASDISFDSSGDDAYYLEFYNKENLAYRIPLMDNSRDSVNYWKWGKDDDNLWFIEGCVNSTCPDGQVFNIREDDYFIVSNSSQEENALTHVLSYDTIDHANKRLTFSDLSGGSVEVTYEIVGAPMGTLGVANMVVGNSTYRIYVNETAYTPSNISFAIAIDQNGDGDVAHDMVNMTTKYGGILALGPNIVNSSGAVQGFGDWIQGKVIGDETGNVLNSVNMTLRTFASQFDEGGLGQISGKNEEIDITLFGSPLGDVNISIFDQSYDGSNYTIKMYDINQSNDLFKKGRTLFGNFFSISLEDYDPSELTIEYPEEQLEALVYLVTGPTSATSTNNTEACVEEWVRYYEECLVNDSKLKYYEDANSCGTFDRLSPTNGSYVECNYCDANWTCSYYNSTGGCIEVLDVNYCYDTTNLSADNYSGNYSEFAVNYSVRNVSVAFNGTANGSVTNSTFNSTTVTSFDIFVGSHNLTLWKTLTGMLDVEFRTGNRSVAYFEYNFTNGSIDLNGLGVEQGNGTVGYVLLRGLNTSHILNQNKTLYLYNLSNMQWVCVKDAEIWDISEITSSCTGSNEHLVKCNGSNYDGYVCEFDPGRNQYNVTGLQHSGVIQSSGPSSSTTTSTTSSSGVSGGGGGGSSISTETSSASHYWSEMKTGESYLMEVNDPAIAVTLLDIMLSENSEKVLVKLNEVYRQGAYQLIKVETENLGKVGKVIVYFKVEKDWMETPKDIRLYVKGEEQSTTPLKSDEEYVYYESTVYLLDELEIGLRRGIEKAAAEEEIPIEEGVKEPAAEEIKEVRAGEDFEQAVNEESDYGMLILGSLVVFIVAGYLVLRKRILT